VPFLHRRPLRRAFHAGPRAARHRPRPRDPALRRAGDGEGLPGPPRGPPLRDLRPVENHRRPGRPLASLRSVLRNPRDGPRNRPLDPGIDLLAPGNPRPPRRPGLLHPIPPPHLLRYLSRDAHGSQPSAKAIAAQISFMRREESCARRRPRLCWLTVITL